jgi:branched-chain amino acid transport system substrate-binding protein
MQKMWVAAILAALAAAPIAEAQQTQGVTKIEIVLGSSQDLSGPLASFSKQTRNGMIMAADEINAAGGIHGRKLRLVFEDHGYDPKKAVLAAQKLLQQDKIFAHAGSIGTATNLAAFPILFDKNVISFFPLTAAREMYEPPTRLKWSFTAPYYEQMRAGVKWVAKNKGAKRFCALYQDDEFGLEVVRGAEQGLKEIDLPMVEKTTYKRGATDFSSQIQRLRTANCDFVVLGTIIRETIGAIGEARKIGWNVEFMGSSASYTDLIHKLGGKVSEGFYAASTVNHPYADDASRLVREWIQKYKAKFNEDPTVFSVYGYLIVQTFAKVAEKAGPNLTTDSWVAAMESFSQPRDIFGSDEMKFSKTQHLGSSRARLSQIRDGKWTPITDYITE